MFDSFAAGPAKVITGWSTNVGVRDERPNIVIDFTGRGDRRELYEPRREPAESQKTFTRTIQRW